MMVEQEIQAKERQRVVDAAVRVFMRHSTMSEIDLRYVQHFEQALLSELTRMDVLERAGLRHD